MDDTPPVAPYASMEINFSFYKRKKIRLFFSKLDIIDI